MWPENELTARLGIDVAIIQAPMAGANTPTLSAAISNGGGLGSLGFGTSNIGDASRQFSEHTQASNRSLNANFFCHDEPESIQDGSAEMRKRLQPWYDELNLGPVPEARAVFSTFGSDHVEMLQALQPKVVSFHFGLPEQSLFDAVRDTGAYILSSATTVSEARWLEAQGVDAIIAQGFEAGGHRGTFLGADPSAQPGLFALLPQVTSAVKVPVIAAGGIADGRTIAAALALGASAVQIGTAFLRCPEANVHPAHRKALAEARDDQTRTTKLFSGKPARGLRNKYMDTFEGSEDLASPFPSQLALSVPLRKGVSEDEMGDVITLWSGQSAALTREMPAADLLNILVEETEDQLNRLANHRK